jgi:hypothetical protein
MTQEPVKPEVIGTSIVEQLTRGEVDMQVSTAKSYPRSIKAFRQRALSIATSDSETAASCFYVLPRGGNKIEGPSIRLAEIVAGAYGNLRCETRVVGETDKTITAQATVWDMESNVLVRKEVTRRVTSRTGQRYSDDMVVMTGNAASSIALRNAIFTVVPLSHVKDIYEECKQASVKTNGLDKSKQACLAWFGEKGIKEDQVVELVGKKSSAEMGQEDIVLLRGVCTAIKEGQTTIEQVFGPTRPENGTHGFGFKKQQETKATKATEEKPVLFDAFFKEEPPKKHGRPKKRPDVSKGPVHPDDMPDWNEPPHDPKTGEVVADEDDIPFG